MRKKIIGVDINEVLRSRSLQFDRYYVQEFGEEGAPDDDNTYVFDLRNEYKFEDSIETTEYLNEDLPDDISPLDYVVDEETGKANVDDLAFKKERKLVTADEKFNRFMYQDFLFEIHGTAPPSYKNLVIDFQKFYNQYSRQFDIRIISKENYFTIPPTLFFLSKLMVRSKNICFVDNNQEVWKNVDILITTDPELLKNVPWRKKVIKVTRPYNKDIKSKIDVLQIKELIDNEKFEKYIKYKK